MMRARAGKRADGRAAGKGPEESERAGAAPVPRGPALPASLTTLSSGTERLRVHSWLFTNESAG